MNIGYACVSTSDQTLNLQLDTLLAERSFRVPFFVCFNATKYVRIVVTVHSVGFRGAPVSANHFVTLCNDEVRHSSVCGLRLSAFK